MTGRTTYAPERWVGTSLTRPPSAGDPGPARNIENCEAGRRRLSEQDLAEIEGQLEGLSPGV